MAAKPPIKLKPLTEAQVLLAKEKRELLEKRIKRSIGFVIVSQIFPVFMGFISLNGKEHSFMEGYWCAWVITLCLAALVGFVALLIWLFK